jgi:hypothetical protein
MNAFDLVSQIGGTLGLFLGLSFLSFAELALEIIFMSLEQQRYKIKPVLANQPSKA